MKPSKLTCMHCNITKPIEDIKAYTTPLHNKEIIDESICDQCWNEGKRFKVYDLQEQKYV